ncbi:alpha/beta hydrolase [Glycomyces buryatensis]|uniref:AB hydrolase-1 domain-containing protein n=1 Tax=Glycomyces buryatensis TaxID=2570927 RepID=A0A4S8Q5X7_9ACTN|nr:alpha/beta fold hydrolase [Glycomyces buryatensis]THV38651.1 hypothetical protein FAB82_19675 [Glycomyces buryatensis]
MIVPPTPRHPHEGRDLGPEFNIARIGGPGGVWRSVAVFDGTVYALSDIAGGHSLVTLSETGQALTDFAQRSALVLDGGGTLDVYHKRGDTVEVDRSSFDGTTWRTQASSYDQLSPTTIRSDSSDHLAVYAKRLYPGLSEFIPAADGKILGEHRWRDRLTGRPLIYGDRIWYLRERWPNQELIARDEQGDVITALTLPPGHLGSIASDGTTVAGVWNDAYTAATGVIATSFEALAESLSRHANDPVYQESACYAYSAKTVDTIPVGIYEPDTPAVGTIVMLHGGPHSTSWPANQPLVSYLARQGWRVAVPNICSSSLAERYHLCEELGSDDAREVATLARHFQARGPVVVLGISYGVYVGARAVSLDAPIDGLIAMSGFMTASSLDSSSHPMVVALRTKHRLPETDAAKLRRVPTIVVHGRRDVRVPVASQRKAAEDIAALDFVELAEEGHEIKSDRAVATAYPRIASWLSATQVSMAR